MIIVRAKAHTVRFIGFSFGMYSKCDEILSPALSKVNTSADAGRYDEMNGL